VAAALPAALAVTVTGSRQGHHHRSLLCGFPIGSSKAQQGAAGEPGPGRCGSNEAHDTAVVGRCAVVGQYCGVVQ
jgi:hypothetical protein